MTKMQSMAIEQLILAFEKGARNGGNVEWEDLEIAYDYACSSAPGIARRVRKELAIHGALAAIETSDDFAGACRYGYSPETCARLCDARCRGSR
jgi:hypothetical protein